MDKFFQIQDAIQKLHQSLKRFNHFKKETKDKKVKELLAFNLELRKIAHDNSLPRNVKGALIERYKVLKVCTNECLELLNQPQLEDSVLENLFTPDCEKVDLGNQSDYSSESEFENFTMAPKLDLGVALKLVDKFSGDADKMTNFFESVDLLMDYYDGVPEADLLKF